MTKKMLKTKRNVFQTPVVKYQVVKGKKVVGRVSLYVVKNNLHKRPYGYIEDLYVEEALRGQGYGKALLLTLIAEAKKKKLYKLVGTSRTFRTQIHSFYEKFGFKKYGFEFRMDL